MTTSPELERIIRPLLAEVIDQAVTASSGELPPTHGKMLRMIEDATDTLKVAILTHLAETGAIQVVQEPPLDTEAIVVRGTN